MPVAVETVRVVDPEPLDASDRVPELRETCGPVGFTVAVSDIVPENPLRLVTVRMAELVEPEATLRAEGLETAVKSGVVPLDCTMMFPLIAERCIEQKYV